MSYRQNYLNLWTKMLKLKKDFQSAETQLKMELKSFADNSTETMKKVISARLKIKKQQRALKRHSLRKKAKAHNADKNKASVQKIHITIVENIRIITNVDYQHGVKDLECEKFQEKTKMTESSFKKFIKRDLQLNEFKRLALTFGLRLIREIILI